MTPPPPAGDAAGQPEVSALANGSQPPLSVLFVCTANICRSAFMELASTTTVAAGSVQFASAGTHGFRDHPMDPVMAATLTSRGVATDQFRSRLLTGSMIRDADLVLTAESVHRRFILDDDAGPFRRIFTLGQFAESVRRLDTDLSGRELVAWAAAHRGPAEPRHDVPDPYRHGSKAAEKCAVQITALLDVILPAFAGRDALVD